MNKAPGCHCRMQSIKCECSKLYTNKKLYRAFSQQANGLTLNISVLQGLVRVNGKAGKDA